MIGGVQERERARARRRRAEVRRRRAALAGAAAAALAAGLAVGAGSGDEAPRPAREAQPAEPPEQAVERLTLEQQVGRMVILRFAGTEAPEYVRRVLREG